MDGTLFWRYTLDFAALIPAAVLCLLPVWEFLENKRRTALAALLFLAAGIFGGAAICAAGRLESNLLLAPLLLLALLLYLQALRGTLSVWRAAFGFCSGLFLQTVCSVLAALICARPEYDNPDPVCLTVTGLVCLGLSAVVCGVYALTAAPWVRWLLREYESERIWRAIWLLPAGYTGLYLFSMPQAPEAKILLVGRVQEISVLTGLLPLGIYLLFLYLFTCIGRESARNLRLTEENHVLTVESRRYDELREYMEKTRTLRHDFRQHLRVISGLSESGRLGELQTYLRQYAGELAEEHTPLCANAAVDAIAAYYDAAAKRAHTPVAWQLDLPQKLPLPEADLCMMLGNLMENALRASEALPEAERRVQVLCRMLSPAMLGLIVENRYDGVLRRRGGKLLSTAHPGSGVGLLSVQTAAGRYHGEVTIETENQLFRVNILLNI